MEHKPRNWRPTWRRVGLGIPILSTDPLPSAQADEVPPVVASMLAAAVGRSAPCRELGPCPTGRRCSEQIRLCNLLHTQDGLKEGEVRHAGLCQTCGDYRLRETT